MSEATPEWWRDLMREPYKPVPPSPPRATSAQRQSEDLNQLIGLLAGLFKETK